MRLQKYRQINNLTLKNLAELLEIEGKNPRWTVDRWCLGLRKPNFDTMEKIEKVTNGAVKYEDFFNHYTEVHEKK